MDETIYVILKLLFDFALEVWFSIILDYLMTYKKNDCIQSYKCRCSYKRVLRTFWLLIPGNKFHIFSRTMYRMFSVSLQGYP